jgi:hypothetical protein
MPVKPCHPAGKQKASLLVCDQCSDAINSLPTFSNISCHSCKLKHFIKQTVWAIDKGVGNTAPLMYVVRFIANFFNRRIA